MGTWTGQEEAVVGTAGPFCVSGGFHAWEVVGRALPLVCERCRQSSRNARGSHVYGRPVGRVSRIIPRLPVAA
jgi:hypothetical protein